MKISSTFPTSSYSLLVIVFIFSVCHNGADGQNAKKVKIDVGLILDLESRVGKMSQSCISIALSDFYSAHENYTTRLVFHTRDSKKDIVEAASAGERVISNLSRFVLIIWVFVVLILTSSYTASLTSKLTVQQLQPTVTDIKDLIKNGDFVGYQSGSYVTGLMQRLGFNTSKLRFYDTLEEYDEALSKGSKNGGVSAIIDEIPYIKFFLSNYSTKYTMVGPTYKTAGFGFAFPKGSSLVPDISRAVLNVAEGDKMVAIEREWFGNQVNYPEQGGSNVTSDSLTLDSFWGLFLIAGVTSVAALTIFFFIFLLEQKDILNSQDTLSRKVSLMAKQFDKVRDGSSTASKKEDPSFNGTTAQVEETRPEQNVDQSSSPAISICHRADMIFSHEDLSSTEPSTPPTLVGIIVARN